MHTTTQRRTYRNTQPFRPLAALAALAATVATLGLAVVTPAGMPHTDPERIARTSAQPAAAPTEVAILPGSIEVVATRSRATARTHSPYLPAVYSPRN